MTSRSNLIINATKIECGGQEPTTNPNFVSSDPTKPIMINGVIPSASSGSGGDVFTNQTNTFTQVNTFNANTVLTTVDTGNINTTGTITASSTVICSKVESSGNVEAGANVECVNVQASGNVECVDVEASGNCTVSGVGIFSGVLNSDNNLQMDTGSSRSIRAVAYGPGRTIISDVDYLDFKQCSKLNEEQSATATKSFNAGIVNNQQFITRFPTATTRKFITEATANNIQRLSYYDINSVDTPFVLYNGTDSTDPAVSNSMTIYPRTIHEASVTVDSPNVAVNGHRVVIDEGEIHIRSLTASIPKLTWNDNSADVSMPRCVDSFESDSVNYNRGIEFDTTTDNTANAIFNISNANSGGLKPVIQIDGAQLQLSDLDSTDVASLVRVNSSGIIDNFGNDLYIDSVSLGDTSRFIKAPIASTNDIEIEPNGVLFCGGDIEARDSSLISKTSNMLTDYRQTEIDHGVIRLRNQSISGSAITDKPRIDWGGTETLAQTGSCVDFMETGTTQHNRVIEFTTTNPAVNNQILQLRTNNGLLPRMIFVGGAGVGNAEVVAMAGQRDILNSASPAGDDMITCESDGGTKFRRLGTSNTDILQVGVDNDNVQINEPCDLFKTYTINPTTPTTYNANLTSQIRGLFDLYVVEVQVFETEIGSGLTKELFNLQNTSFTKFSFGQNTGQTFTIPQLAGAGAGLGFDVKFRVLDSAGGNETWMPASGAGPGIGIHSLRGQFSGATSSPQFTTNDNADFILQYVNYAAHRVAAGGGWVGSTQMPQVHFVMGSGTGTPAKYGLYFPSNFPTGGTNPAVVSNVIRVSLSVNGGFV